MLSVDEINKLQQENKRLNDIIDSYQPRLQKYKDVLQEIKTIVSGDYEMLDPQTLQDIRSIITKVEEE